jgi:hypothetical protein
VSVRERAIACVCVTLNKNSVPQNAAPYFNSLTSSVRRYRRCEIRSTVKSLSVGCCISKNMPFARILIFAGVIICKYICKF